MATKGSTANVADVFTPGGFEAYLKQNGEGKMGRISKSDSNGKVGAIVIIIPTQIFAALCWN